MLMLDFVCSVTQFEKGKKQKCEGYIDYYRRLFWLFLSILGRFYWGGAFTYDDIITAARHERFVRLPLKKKNGSLQQQQQPLGAINSKNPLEPFLEIIINTKCDVEPSQAEPRDSLPTQKPKAQPKPRPGPTPALHLQPP